MTILSVAYPLLSVSEDSAGGSEQILHLVERELVDTGHLSVVIAAEGSSIRGHLLETPGFSGEITDEVRRSAQQSHREAIAIALQRYPIDLIHFHGLDFHEYIPEVGVPMLATLHLPLSWYPEDLLERAQIELNLVSHSQANSHRAAAGWPVICNGVDISRYRERNGSGEFLLVLARVCPEKGIDVALRVAHRLDLPLVVAGPVHPFETHQQYFREQVEPLLDERRRYVGAVGIDSKVELLSRAKCLLIPSLVAETSSLAAMEAISSGTPVISFKSGALPEVIDYGTTGFLAASEDQMADAVGRIKEISSETCRSIAEVRFDARRMAREYLALYDRLRTKVRRSFGMVSAPQRAL
jgi:glycosyltransferase involved in cell wall biosynthesis